MAATAQKLGATAAVQLCVVNVRLHAVLCRSAGQIINISIGTCRICGALCVQVVHGLPLVDQSLDISVPSRRHARLTTPNGR